MPTSNASPEARDEFVHRLGWGFTAVAIMFGVAVIACHLESGPRRWSAAAWQFALHVPGSPATWGVAILAGGLLMLYGKTRHARRPFRWGCQIAFWWLVLLAGASLLAFCDDPEVNPMSPIAWGGFAFVYASLFTATKT